MYRNFTYNENRNLKKRINVWDTRKAARKITVSIISYTYYMCR